MNEELEKEIKNIVASSLKDINYDKETISSLSLLYLLKFKEPYTGIITMLSDKEKKIELIKALKTGIKTKEYYIDELR